MKNKKGKQKFIEVYSEWHKGWVTADIFVKIDQRKKLSPNNKLMLKIHTLGKPPFVVFKPNEL